MSWILYITVSPVIVSRLNKWLYKPKKKCCIHSSHYFALWKTKRKFASVRKMIHFLSKFCHVTSLANEVFSINNHNNFLYLQGKTFKRVYMEKSILKQIHAIDYFFRNKKGVKTGVLLLQMIVLIKQTVITVKN